jgi:hypothetical protein
VSGEEVDQYLRGDDVPKLRGVEEPKRTTLEDTAPHDPTQKRRRAVLLQSL